MRLHNKVMFFCIAIQIITIFLMLLTSCNTIAQNSETKTDNNTTISTSVPTISISTISTLVTPSTVTTPSPTTPASIVASLQTSDSSAATITDFYYNPSYFSFENIVTLGIALKGYELTDAVKNDPRFSEEDKEIIRKLQKNKGHNSFMFDIPVFADRTYKLCDPVKLIYESDIKKGAGAHDRYVGFGIGFTVTDGENSFDLDMYDWFVYDRNPEYTEAISGKIVLDNENAVVIELGTSDSFVVYDLYLNRRDYHARLSTNAPIESVLSLVKALQLDVYIYDDIT